MTSGSQECRYCLIPSPSVFSGLNSKFQTLTETLDAFHRPFASWSHDAEQVPGDASCSFSFVSYGPLHHKGLQALSGKLT